MSEILGATYELLQKIGSGGGGNVYLANHLRLNKKVVLKADKRSLSTRTDLLRREADVLKTLDHPYIPKVYDIFVENETVYTVLDYIEGESLDKMLHRGELPIQPQVVQWAIELLEALDYLHSPIHGTPPHGYIHGDIKPANLMLRENGKICLIDFNISLAIGEESRIGGSAGYASPEHFGLDYSYVSADRTWAAQSSEENTQTQTFLSTDVTSSGRKIIPDARSDVYSVGATLYHLLSGRKPARDALDVLPLSTLEASGPLVKIISRAMSPNPELRYQNAAKMLAALRGLWTNDPRSRRLRRAKRITAGLLTVSTLCSAALCFIGLRRMNAVQHAQLLASQSADALAAGDKTQALRLALDAFPDKTGLLTPPAPAEAQKALTDALGIYELSSGLHLASSLTLSSETLGLRLSPDGTLCAAASLGCWSIFQTENGQLLTTLRAADNAQAGVVFLDNSTLVYAAPDGLTVHDLNTNLTIWQGEAAAQITVSANGTSIAAASPDGRRAVIYAPDGAVRREISFDGHSMQTVSNNRFADAADMLFALNEEGTILAVSFADGSLNLYDVVGLEDIAVLDLSSYTHFEGGFHDSYFAFSATDVESSLFAVIDTATLEQTGGFQLPSRIGVQTDVDGIYLSNDYTLVQIDPLTGEQTELAFTNSVITDFQHTAEHTLVWTQDGRLHLFNSAAMEEADPLLDELHGTCAALWNGGLVLTGLDSPLVQVLHFPAAEDDAVILRYAPGYTHDEARINSDGTAVMLFSYRGFCLIGIDGKILQKTELPDAAHIYDQQYYRDESGSRLEVDYEDGHIDVYSGDTGELLFTRQETAPDESLAETFLTEDYCIESPLHGTPTVYDRESGRQIGQLERDAYLTYVTQLGNFLLTEYINEDGTRWGLLLDGQLQPLAELPQLCDATPGRLIFDDQLGTLRQSRIYSIEELLQLAKKELEET